MKIERSKGALTGIIAVAFLIIGYQTALFIHHAAVMKIVANRDHPDTIYVYKTESVKDEVVRKNSSHPQRAVTVRSTIPRKSVENFKFNPNTVSEDELCRLGFSPKQAASILAYRNKGGRFNRKSDFAASFVVSESIYKRLEPYIDIPLIDLNLADSADFDSLPGIGGWFASKMVSYRNQLRGYSYKEQLMDIWKFDQDKFDALSDLITINPENISPYPLWTLPADSLCLHPYIRNHETALAIVVFRENNPPEKHTIHDLEQSCIISSETAARLSLCAIKPSM